MMKVSIKNNTDATITVPLSALVPNAVSIVEAAAPGASAECVYRIPTGVEEVQNAILAWSQANGIDVAISFMPTVMPSTLPEPTPVPAPPVFDPMNPLGI